MASSIEFIIDRAHKTRSAQAEIAGVWVWDEKTLAVWDTDIAAVHTQNDVLADAEADKNGLAGELDVLLAALHNNTVKGLNIAKAKYRNDPAKLHLFKNVTANANSRAGQLEEARLFESAWRDADAAWLPVAGMTLAGFKTARLACDAKLEAYDDAKANWRGEAGKFNVMLEALEDACVGWYKAATAVFPEGTAEGDMIRGTVPTTYTPPPGDLPEQPVITAAMAATGQGYHLDFSGENATSHEVWGKAPGETEFVLIADGIVSGDYDATGQAVGGWESKVYGRNANGLGPASEVASITVA